VVFGSLVSSAATGAGLMAAAIAVCGFLAHAWPAMTGKSDAELRMATVVGGLSGFAISIFVIALSKVVA
jgi:hypothetical protein